MVQNWSSRLCEQNDKGRMGKKKNKMRKEAIGVVMCGAQRFLLSEIDWGEYQGSPRKLKTVKPAMKHESDVGAGGGE